MISAILLSAGKSMISTAPLLKSVTMDAVPQAIASSRSRGHPFQHGRQYKHSAVRNILIQLRIKSF